MSNIALSVKNLRFRYRDRVGAALQGISFSADKGELLLIAGASAAAAKPP
jgi:energy-coupling factor transporter ATP-binding protein EcfA2